MQLDFWDHHGLLFLLCMFFFPRLTMLFATPWGGILWWLGWVFAPRVTVAVLATIVYGGTNPFLVILTWIWALALEPAEKVTIHRQGRRIGKTRHR
jgi:hypothetical protein